MKKLLFTPILITAAAFAQTSIPVQGTLTLNGSLDAGSATATAPMKKGTSLPASCTVGDQYFKTDATAGQNLYGCTATNTWTAQAGSSGTAGGSTGQIQINSSGAFAGRNFPGLTDNGTSLIPDGTVFAELGGNNTYTGHGYFPASSTQSIAAAGNSVTCDRLTVAISPTSALTLTSAPTIASGTDGQKCTIVNVGTNNLIIQDQDTLASSNLQLASSSVTIPPKGQLTLQYNSTVGDWIQDGVAAGGSSSPLTTKGDVYTRSSSADARLAVGTDGQYLTADSAQTNGIKWYTPLERRFAWPAVSTGNATALLGGNVVALAYGGGLTSSGVVGAPLTQVGAAFWRFAAGETGTSYFIMRTPGMALSGSSTANISNMDVKMYIHKVGAWVGTAKFRIEAACANLDTGVMGSAMSYTTPSYTSVTGSTTNVRQLVTFSNVLSGLTCGPNSDIFLKPTRGQTTADSDSETNIDVTGIILEITR